MEQKKNIFLAIAAITLAIILAMLIKNSGLEDKIIKNLSDQNMMEENSISKIGNAITVHYVGTLTNGVKFDSSRDRGEPFTFTLGQSSVIQCWDTGLIGRKAGDKFKLTCPPETAYGTRAIGNIPPNSTLTFDIEVLEIK